MLDIEATAAGLVDLFGAGQSVALLTTTNSAAASSVPELDIPFALDEAGPRRHNTSLERLATQQWRIAMSTRLCNRHGVPIASPMVEEFAAGLAGKMIQPADPDYDTARQIWNAAIDRHPGLIVRCLGVADVIQAVRFARANDLLVAVRGGGHNVAGRALCDDGIVIDLSAMRGVLVDARTRTVQVQGGAMLGDLDRETHLHGLAVPTGVVSKTGVAGLTLGGGVGWLVRKHGLSCDNVISFEVVTAAGDLVSASAEENSDLFWALRGGGGNFGIVTCFRFRAQPISMVLGGLIAHPRERAGEMLRFYRDFMATAPEELTAYAAMVTTPDGMPAVAMIGCWCGDMAEGERVLAPLRAYGPPALDAIQPMPFPAMQGLLNMAFPDRSHNYWKASFVPKLTDEVIDLLVEHGNRMQSALSGVVVEFYGGAPGRVSASESAFTQRQAEYNIGITAQWSNPAESAKHIAWARAMYEALEPYSNGNHFLNFQSEAGDDVIRRSFGKNYDRLAEVKRKYDPTNFFSLNQNIKAAAA
ncbi:FAD-binding oxidoreductase [Mesorhizobium sp. ESP7-2]|uniref:FAD-binding oxidoreductase n=1 Tax=Mesorhizobium sp. ESP7-2 TaxID=2876622 RepID=UPI001CCF3A5A|nr:FAD-binding oxidoreductase [Mesorhizobium sp. ESP7-2]MBZ9711260.1 FAD-binding oxidoreductase [Mesorhizobium sp. ESP7-2]